MPSALFVITTAESARENLLPQVIHVLLQGHVVQTGIMEGKIEDAFGRRSSVQKGLDDLPEEGGLAGPPDAGKHLDLFSVKTGRKVLQI
jgi:hypothetical protein